MTNDHNTSSGLHGITAYAAYVPNYRVDLADLAAVLGSGRGAGTRIVAGPDEDTTTMAVEAARQVVRSHDPNGLWFATSRPAYLEKNNASLIHAALGLSPQVAAFDVGGAVRSGTGAMQAAASLAGVAVLSDLRIGLPESDDERTGGDAAVAFSFGPDGVIAEILSSAHQTVEVLDRWRFPYDSTVEVWDERFAVAALGEVATEVGATCLKQAGLERVDYCFVATPHRRLAGAIGSQIDANVVTDAVGFAGAAQFGLGVASILDRLAPGETALVMSLVDGADAWVIRATDLIDTSRQDISVDDQAAAGRTVHYANYLTWRGLLTRQPPRRPDPQAPAAPPAWRGSSWKHALVGGRCAECGNVSLPPQRVCHRCGSADQLEFVPIADQAVTVATVTVDWLAYSLSPPVVMAVVDVDGGGRMIAEVTDASADEIEIGTRLEPTFRRISTAEGIHNYFWKLRPLRRRHGK